VAQVCDLLDAATALARVPLLALIAVREASGDINRKAWTGSSVPDGLKERILIRSLEHDFAEQDFIAIAKALKELNGLGNHAAWDRVRETFGGRKGLHRFLWDYSSNGNESAVDDLGSDDPKRTETLTTTYARDPRVRREVERRSNGRCEFCGAIGFSRTDGTRYVETHHIIALANDGVDRVTNVIGLCPNHHKEAHFGNRREALERQMVRMVNKLNRA
jgi:5-methylcytosine-specific restriction endonuclease McrA